MLSGVGQSGAVAAPMYAAGRGQEQLSKMPPTQVHVLVPIMLWPQVTMQSCVHMAPSLAVELLTQLGSGLLAPVPPLPAAGVLLVPALEVPADVEGLPLAACVPPLEAAGVPALDELVPAFESPPAFSGSLLLEQPAANATPGNRATSPINAKFRVLDMCGLVLGIELNRLVTSGAGGIDR